jgi:hypothetical protein
MFEFLKSKNTQVRETAAEADAEAAADHFPSTQLAEPSRMEVADAVLKDVLRKHTIPNGWVSCEVREVLSGSQKTKLQIQLVINRWSEQLMRYTGALQQQFLDAFDEFEPHVDHASYVVVWRFSESCNMPFPTIPENVKWYVSATSAEQPTAP